LTAHAGQARGIFRQGLEFFEMANQIGNKTVTKTPGNVMEFELALEFVRVV